MGRKIVSTTCVTLALGLSVPLASEARAETARGIVFDDRDGDGARDRGEPGIAGVVVSDGADVVRTDADGSWTLDVDDGDVVFVVKPSGWSVSHDDDHVPRFYYVYDPDGTPADLDLRYPGVAPTGPLPESIDFPLRSIDEPERFRVVLFADTQPQTDRELDYIRDRVVAPLVGTDAAFGMTVGDIAFDDMSLLPRLNRLIGRIGVPWYNVPGNHELNLRSPDDRHSLETFKRLYGPTYYSFDVGKTHFVVLDDVDYLGRGVGRENPHPRQAGLYEGRIGEAQLDWLRNDLAEVAADRLVVLAMHIPLRSARHPDAARVNVADRTALFEVLRGRKHVLALAGHMHVVEHHWFGKDDGADPELHQHVLSTVSGSWWSGPFDETGIPTSWQRDGTPNGWSVLEIDGNRAEVRFVPAALPRNTQMRIMLDPWFHRFSAGGMRDFRMGELIRGRITVDQVPPTEVLVNVFNGGPRSSVTLRIDGGSPIAMRREHRPDPFIEELYHRHEDTLKPWVEVEPSTHLWVADLPDDVGPGVHVIEARATDEYGLEHVDHLVFEVGSP